jgi:hypothetical protein
MRLSIVGVAAAAMVFAGCSSSSTSGGSIGSTGSTGQGASGSTTTATSTSGSTGHGTTSTVGSTGGSTGSTAGSTSGTGSTGASLCTPSTVASSGSSGNSYACLGSAGPIPAATGPATIVLALVDQNRVSLGAGLTVKACLETDATCANPVATSVSDASGFVTLTATLPSSGFPGYFDITGRQEFTNDGGDPAKSVFPELVYYPAVKTDGGPQGIIGVRQNDADQISFATGVNFNPDRGQIIGNIADCAIHNAVGAVAFTSNAPSPDGGNVNMYFAPVSGFGEVPSPANPDTDGSGNYVVANVASGQTTVTAYVHASCTRIGSRTVQIRPGTITNVLIVPN